MGVNLTKTPSHNKRKSSKRMHGFLAFPPNVVLTLIGIAAFWDVFTKNTLTDYGFNQLVSYTSIKLKLTHPLSRCSEFSYWKISSLEPLATAYFLAFFPPLRRMLVFWHLSSSCPCVFLQLIFHQGQSIFWSSQHLW